MSLRKYAGLIVFSTALMASGLAIADDATIDQVYQTAESGHLAQAQAMMDKVLQDHPNSAKAHYVEADLLARGGNLNGAQNELANAQRIDPSGSYAKPGAIQELRAQIAAGQRARPTPNNFSAQPPVNYPQRSSGLPWALIIVVIAVIAFIVMVARTMGRRNVMMAPGGYPVGGGYGPGGYPMGGGGMMGGGMMGGGMGSGIVGGLATGAAVGAGLVAGEELMHHFTDGNQGGNYNPNQGGGWDNAQPNSDMGGNDFGVNDAGSWDSGGGGGGDMGGGGGDWN